MQRLQSTKCRISVGNAVPGFYKCAGAEDKTSFGFRDLSRGIVKFSGVPEKYIASLAIYISCLAIYIPSLAIFISRLATYFASTRKKLWMRFRELYKG